MYYTLGIEETSSLPRTVF